MLLKAIGKSFEADKKIWMMASKDQMEISTFSDLSQYMNKLASLVEQRKTSKKVRFMMMVVLKLQANKWENKKSRYKENTLQKLENERQEQNLAKKQRT